MGETRIQLCGRLLARIDDERVDDRLPGRQGRLLFALLVLERRRSVGRDVLGQVLWGDDPPDAPDSAVSSLLSRLRRLVAVEGRSEVRLLLPADAWVDVEAATEALLAYDALRRLLRDDLGVAPSAETQALHRALLG